MPRKVRVRIPNFGHGPVAIERVATLLCRAPDRPDKVLLRDERGQVFQVPEADIIEEV